MVNVLRPLTHYLERHYRLHPRRVIVLSVILLLHILLIIGLLSNSSQEELPPQAAHNSLAVTMIAPPPEQPPTPAQTSKGDYVTPMPQQPSEPSPLEQISHEHAQKKQDNPPQEKPPQPLPPPPVKPTPVTSKKKSPVHSRKPVKAPPSKTNAQQQQMSAQPNAGQSAMGQGQVGQGQGQGQGDGSAGSTPLNGAKPVYPPDMQAENVEGRVTAMCDVLPNGTTRNCHIKGVSGGDSFANSAMTYLSKAVFQPAIRNGVPITEFQKVYVIRYRLDE